MKILYDHQIFYIQKFGGISRYFYELMNHSKNLFEYDIPRLYSDNIYVKLLKKNKEFPLKFNFKGKGRIINYINKTNSIKKLKNKNYDIIHPTYYDPYIINEITKITQRKNDKMFAFNLEIPEEKEKIIYKEKTFLENNYNYERQNYILFTGQRGTYKNFFKFIEAVSPLLFRYNLRLICTGQELTKDEIIFLNKYKIVEKTKVVFASETELQDFYSKALLFVFPSLYEGFGFPILEAFTTGCPMVLSNTSCFPEIAGDAAIYFDPYSVDDIRDKIENVILSNSLRTMLIKRGFERLKHFSWEKTVKQTYQLYSDLINNNISNEIRLVVTVHDMIHELFPKCFSVKDKTKNNKYIMMKNADKIIAISENTKMDIINIYPKIDKKKITVIYHGN